MPGDYWWNRLPEPIRKVRDLSLYVLGAYSEAQNAADLYQRVTSWKVKRGKSETLAKYGDRFISWMYELEHHADMLLDSINSVGDTFVRAANGVVERCQCSDVSAHHLVISVASSVTDHVSSAIIQHLAPDFFKQDCGAVVPPLVAKKDFERALPAAVQAFTDWDATAGHDFHSLSSLLEQELAVIASIEPPSVAWSRPLKMMDLQEDLGISRNTLKKRLVRGSVRVEGKIRYIGEGDHPRIIQVAIDDLPAKLQAKYRP